MSSPEVRSTEEMLAVVTRRAAYRMGRRARRHRITKLAAVVVVLAAVAGVGLYARSDSGNARFQTVGARIDGDSSAEQRLRSGAGGSATDSARLQIVEGDRDVVSTGSITVRVDDVERSAKDAAAIATDAGGYVATSETELGEDPKVHITLRVPAEGFREAMAQAAALGDVQSSTTDARDVTDQVVDLEGRLKTAQVTSDRLRELLVDAQNLQNIITINDRLAALETEIEQITGELDAVKDQVALATVSVHLTEESTATVSDDLPGPLEALRTGAVAFVNVVLFAAAALAFALPFLAVALAGWWIVRRWRNRGVHT
ncbi:MAG: DUF4349 domain-containing protein [Aquihabitans sp.]